MSRLPLPDQPSSTPSPAEIVGLVEALKEAPVIVTHDSELDQTRFGHVERLAVDQQGWSEKPPDDPRLKPFG